MQLTLRSSTPPAVINREHFFFENMLRHNAIKHWRDAVDCHVWVAHPQDSVELGKDKGHGRQRGGLSKHLDDWNAPNLQGRTKRNSQRSTGPGRSLLHRQLKLWTHHNHILAQKSPNISWSILNGKARSVLHMSLRFRGIIPVMSNWKFTSKARLRKTVFYIKHSLFTFNTSPWPLTQAFNLWLHGEFL